MLLVSGDIGHENIDWFLSESRLHLSHKTWGIRTIAACDVFVEVLQEVAQDLNTLDNFCVIFGQEGDGSFLDALMKLVLMIEASLKIFTDFFSDELVHDSIDVGLKKLAGPPLAGVYYVHLIVYDRVLVRTSLMTVATTFHLVSLSEASLVAQVFHSILAVAAVIHVVASLVVFVLVHQASLITVVTSEMAFIFRTEVFNTT